MRSWLRAARAGGTDYLVIIPTPWGEGEVSWSCNVTFDFKHFLRSTFSFLTHCTLRQLVYVAHWGVGELSKDNLFFLNTHEVFLHLRDPGINNISPHALPLSL